MSDRAVECLSLSMRDIESRPPLPLRCPFSARCWFSSTLVENLLANFSAFGDKRNRSDLDRVGGFGSIIGCARASDVILWITRTPKRTMERRVKRSSPWSAKLNQKLNKIVILLSSTKVPIYIQIEFSCVTYPNVHECRTMCRWGHQYIVWLGLTGH